MTRIFVSYAHADKEQVHPIARELQDLGFDVWIDERGVKVGAKWEYEIVKAITNCDFFLLFVSAHSVKSKNVLREVSLASKNEKNFIPMKLDNAEIPPEWEYQTAGIHWLDIKDPNWKSRLLVGLGGHESNIERDKTEHPDAPLSTSSDISPPSIASRKTPDISSKPKIIVKIEQLCENKHLSGPQRDALIGLFMSIKDYSFKEVKMSPQDMNQSQVVELYQNSTQAVAYFLNVLTENQASLLERRPFLADPVTEESITLLTSVQQQVLLVATVARIHSPEYYEIFQFESKMLLSSIRKLKMLLADLDKYLIGSESIPDNIHLQMEKEFEDLIFGAGRVILLIQDLSRPTKKTYMQ